jgi:hypothetical protein
MGAVTTFLALVVPALVGALVGVLTTSWKSRKDLETAYDIKLRELRITAYGELWRTQEPLATYAPPAPLTPAVAASVSTAIRSWFFTTGGLVLSARSRVPYFELQRALTEAAAAGSLDDAATERLRALGSALRTATTDDVGSRVGSRLSRAARDE